ncbi:reticulocalbin-3-like [Camarhynchus parvulus]|uniref:reticulocalbin-3-like n=1 Tax=Geospiza parvula TaxID=87175 RepID=UPI0012381378|nr:reticulocalbin-3-like [Camarhynchus parvulus]
MLPCSLWPLLALALGGSPHAPQPHFGAPHGHEDPQGLFYDHAALWGAQEAREQRELPPEESRRRLGLLVGLMDADASGLLSRAELRAWILRRHRGSRQAALRSESARLDRDSDGVVTWHEFSAQSFGDTQDFGGSPDPEAHRKLLERSRRRFRAADEDGDGRLEAAELDAFLHPEDFPRLQDLVVQETIEDLDRDGDGFVQVDEYIADLFEGPPGSPEPPEIQREREQFLRVRDQDRDGRLGPPEVKLWLSPPSPDWAGVEAEHLIHHADQNQDGALSREEILGRWELFVGSRATDYGQDLHRGHDEL